MSRLRPALATGLVLGALWGAAEALVVLLLPWFGLWAALGHLPPLDPVEVGVVAVLGAVRYAAVGLVVAGLLALLVQPVVERLTGHTAERFAPAALVTFIVFVNLYWWTKPLWAFSWGLPFYHWKRLALAAGWLVLAGLVARVVVRPKGGLGVPSRRTTLVVVAVLLVGGGAAWLRERALTGPGPGTAPADAPNVLLVVVDALRADQLGCYGYQADPPTSPHVDALADQGVLFEHAWTQAPFTWTSFGSFLTGKYPRHHGLIKMSPDQRLDLHRNRTLAQALSEAGYATGAFLTGTLSNNTGLLGGFDTYFETLVGHEPVDRHSKWSVVRSRMLLSILWTKLRQARDPRLVNTEALAWIEDHADQPFFALVHYYSTHTPYDPPAPYDTLYDPDYDGPFHPFLQSQAVTIMKHEWGEGVCPIDGKPCWTCEHFDPQRDVAHIRALYDGGVAFADDMLGDLLDLLDREGLADDTLVIFTGDHGEELYDHHVFDHDWMFETNLRVPLVMRLPQGAHAGTRVDWPVELIDLPPTVLDAAGRGSLPGIDGRSLLPDAAGVEPPPAEHTVFAENVRYLSMRDDRYKLTVNRYDRSGRLYGTRAFDLLADPGETTPLDPDDPDDRPIVTDLLARLRAWDDSMPGLDDMPSFTPSRELLDTLTKLGYVGGINSDATVAGGNLEQALGESLMLGSNQILEEQLYARPAPGPAPGDG